MRTHYMKQRICSPSPKERIYAGYFHYEKRDLSKRMVTNLRFPRLRNY